MAKRIIQTAIKGDYAIIILNAEDAVLDPVLDLYYIESQEQHKRRAIATISMENIILHIMSEKTNPKILESRSLLQSGQPPTMDCIMQVIQIRTDEYLKENNRILTVQHSNEIFNLLEFWTANDDPNIEQPAEAKPNTKAKAKSKPAKDTGKKPLAFEPMQRVELPKYVTKNWSPLAIRGQSSNCQIYVEDSPIDGPSLYIILIGIYRPELLTRLVKDKAPMLAILRLVTNQRTKLFDSPHGSYANYWSEIDRIRTEDDYKAIGFYNFVTFVNAPQVLRHDVNQVSDELSGMAFDAHDRRRQHQHYVANIRVLDVSGFRPMDGYPLYDEYFRDMPMERQTVECVMDAMLAQVDALIEKPSEKLENVNVVKRLTHPSLNSLGDIREENSKPKISKISYGSVKQATPPLFFYFEDKLIFEQQDVLLHSLVVNDEESRQPSLHLDHYDSHLDASVKAWQLDRVIEIANTMSDDLLIRLKSLRIPHQQIEWMLNALVASKMTCPKFISKDDTQDPPVNPIYAAFELMIEQALCPESEEIDHHIELLSPGALRQQILHCVRTYDTVVHCVLPLSASVLLTFDSQPADTVVIERAEPSLMTCVCFRDYIDFVRDEHADWMRKEDEQYDIENDTGDLMMNVELDEAEKQAEKRKAGMPFVPNADFWVNRSLKKHGNVEYVGDVELKEAKTIKPMEEESGTNKKSSKGEKNAAKTKTKSGKKLASISSQQSMQTTNNGQMANADAKLPFVGYGLNDLRQQLHNQVVKYSTAMLSLRLVVNAWKYCDKVLNVIADLDGVHMLFGQNFVNGGRPSRNVDSVLLKLPNGLRWVVELVRQNPVRVPQLNHWDKEKPVGCQEEEEIVSGNGEVIEEAQELVLRICRPNGLIVRTLPNLSSYAVEQMWLVTKTGREEKRRVMLANGWVQVYYADGNMCVMTSNGMIAETCADFDGWSVGMTQTSETESAGKLSLKKKNSKSSGASLRSKNSTESTTRSISKPEKIILPPELLHVDVLDSLLTTLPELADKHYKLTTCDGCVYLVSGRSIVKTLEPLFETELRDYLLDESYVRRNDGVQMLYKPGGTRCLYPDGTQIWSNDFVEDMPSFADFELDDVEPVRQNADVETTSVIEQPESEPNAVELSETSSLFDYSETSSAKERHLVDYVVTKFIRVATDACFTYVDRWFRVQHPAYETVEFRNVCRKSVQFPDQNVRFTHSELSAQLTQRISMQCDTNRILLVAEQCAEHKKESSVELNFSRQAEHILECDDGFQRYFNIDQYGQHIVEDAFALPKGFHLGSACGCSYSCKKPRRQFVVKRDWIDGYEIVPTAMVESMLSDPESKAFVVDRDDDMGTVTVLYPMGDVEADHDESDKFQRDVHNVKCCVMSVDVRTQSLRKLPSTLVLRHFSRVPDDISLLQSALEAMKNSTAVQMSSKETIKSLSNVQSPICGAVDKAMRLYLANKEREEAERIKRMSVRPSVGFYEKKALLLDELRRTKLYRHMLNTGFMPEYHQVLDAQGLVRNMDADVIEENMTEWEKKQLEIQTAKTTAAMNASKVTEIDESFTLDEMQMYTIDCSCANVPCHCRTKRFSSVK